MNEEEEKMIKNMKLHVKIRIANNITVLRVINGWVYLMDAKYGFTSCFVPEKGLKF